MDIRIENGRLCGAVEVPASKSDAHRLLICAALAQSESLVGIRTGSDDIAATVDVLRGLGAGIDVVPDGVRVRPIETRFGKETVLDCRESGSTLRFLLPVTAALGVRARFTGSGRLPARPMGLLTGQLRLHGVGVQGDSLPIDLSGQLCSGTYTLPGDVSSQYITGLLFALPILKGDSDILLTTPLESAGYVDMTLRALAQFGVRIDAVENGWHIPGGQQYRSPGRLRAEGDWSAAAFWLCAGALGSRIGLEGLCHCTAQGDRGVLACLEALGARVAQTAAGCSAAGPLRPDAAVTVDGRDIPDLIPVLAVCAAGRRGTTRFANCGRLRLKESDRIAAVCDMLNALGGEARCVGDDIFVLGRGTLTGGTVNGRGDHRIVMSAAVASGICTGPVTVKGAEAVSKSYPAFFEEFQRMGGIFHVI